MKKKIGVLFVIMCAVACSAALAACTGNNMRLIPVEVEAQGFTVEYKSTYESAAYMDIPGGYEDIDTAWFVKDQSGNTVAWVTVNGYAALTDKKGNLLRGITADHSNGSKDLVFASEQSYFSVAVDTGAIDISEMRITVNGFDAIIGQDTETGEDDYVRYFYYFELSNFDPATVETFAMTISGLKAA